MMFARTGIAWAEFRIGFSRRETGASGVRDFAFLAAFFGLMTFLILFGWSVRDGLWGRIEQILLGALPRGQPPVRLSYHIDNVNKINANVLREFRQKFPTVSIVVERSSDGASGALILPGLSASEEASSAGSWGRGVSDKRVTPLRIDALPLEAPLWRWSLARTPDVAAEAGRGKSPLLLAASRHLFREHFRYDDYRRAILANRMVPCDLKQFLPERLSSIDQLENLVLEVKENFESGRGRSSVPSYQGFRVVWVDSFPTPEQTAMILPLSTYELLLVAAERQNVSLHVEALDGGSGERIAEIKLAEVDIEREGIAEFTKLASCLGAVATDEPIDGEGAHAPAADICNVPVAALRSALDREAIASDPIGSCERLRERAPIKYPRLISNGQDLMICSGEHRRLRSAEVTKCAHAAGLEGLQPGAALFGNRLDLLPVSPPPAVDWIGPSRIAAPCGALDPRDLVLARALQEDWARARRQGAEAKPAPDRAEADSWIAGCEAYRKANPSDTSGGPRAVITLLGYQDATVYAPADEPESKALTSFGKDTLDFLRRAIGNFGQLAAADRTREEGGRTRVPDDGALNTLTKSLLNWETMLGVRDGGQPATVFRLDPAYESALVRFGVLSLILDKVSTPLMAASLTLYVFLTAVILATAVTHRKRQYGLLLMNGSTSGDIGYIVALQIALSCIVGGVAGCSAFMLVAFAVNGLLAESQIIADARRIIGLDVPSFLPSIGELTIFALWCGMTFIAVLVGTLILRLQGITTARAPIELVKS
jgi:hypothetical protein